jgi:hypothetical protein
MTDSTDNPFIAMMSVAHTNLAQANVEQQKQHDYLMSLLIGRVAEALTTLSPDQLEAVAAFIANDCEPETIIDFADDANVEELRRQLADVERERDEFKAKAEKASPSCEFHLDLMDQENIDYGKLYFGELSNGKGRFVPNGVEIIRAGRKALEEEGARQRQQSNGAQRLPGSPPAQRAANASGNGSSGRQKGKKKGVVQSLRDKAADAAGKTPDRN